MKASYYLTCLWPGLPELWWRGRLSGLPVAIAFTVALNTLLVSRYLYPGWISAGLVSMAFWTGVSCWVFSILRSARELPQLITPRQVSDAPDRFPEAHQAYLRGDYEQAEDLLQDVLAIEPRDPPALLLLTAVFRHTERLEMAELLLDEVARLEAADAWWLEVAAEKQRLIRDQAADDQADESAEQPENSDRESIEEDRMTRPMAA